LEIGLLLPCNVIVYEEDGSSIIAIVDPLVMLGVVANPAIVEIANEAGARLQRVMTSIAN
jgi:uncharacterized protein (DUF302 family)